MTDERVDLGPKTTSPDSADSDEDPYRAALDDINRIRAELEQHPVDAPHFGQVALALAYLLGNFTSAFIQALGQRAADGAAKLPKRAGDLVRRCIRRKGKPDEYHIGVDDGSAATIAITADTPDEARLALLDLDVTADELRGKLLRWDSSASAWRPAGES